MVEFKKCLKCKLEKEVNYFFVRLKGYASHCKDCIRKYNKIKQQANYRIPESLKGEIWHSIDDNYHISNIGRLKSFTRSEKGIILKKRTDSNGYIMYLLKTHKSSKKAHRLVAQAFIPNPENKPEVNHINGIKNDNRVENLEWVTSSENIIHSYRIGLQKIKIGEDNNSAKLTELNVITIREKYSHKFSKNDLKIFCLEQSAIYSVNIISIKNVINRKTWNHI